MTVPNGEYLGWNLETSLSYFAVVPKRKSPDGQFKLRKERKSDVVKIKRSLRCGSKDVVKIHSLLAE